MATPGSLVIQSGANQDGIINTYYPNRIAVLALDTGGSPMPNEPIVFSLPVEGPAAVTGIFAWTFTRTCTAYTDANGIATSEQIMANGRIGVFTGLVQFVNALGISTPFPNMHNINNTPYGYRMEYWSGGGQKTAQNAAFANPFVVQVWDQYGNTWGGGDVSFSGGGANGSWGGSVNVTTDANGFATSPIFTANSTVGSFNVTATTTSYPRPNETVSVTWTTVNPTIATSLSLVSGGGQKVPPSTLFPNPLVVRVNNGLGQGLSGITVTFTAPGTGASCTFTGAAVSVTAVSDGSGNATTVPKPTANATLGAYNVVASASGLTSVNLGLTNGLNYFAEVCTAFVAATAASNQSPGTTDWINLANAYNGNTTGASVNTVTSVTPKRLYVSGFPAALLADIHDQAKITKFQATFDVYQTVTTGTHRSTIYTDAQSGAWVPTPINLQWTPGSYRANAPVYIADTFPQVTGAQVKATGFGVGFTINANVTTNTIRVRLLKISICYQNPDLPPDPTTVRNPLIFCEA